MDIWRKVPISKMTPRELAKIRMIPSIQKDTRIITLVTESGYSLSICSVNLVESTH